MIPTLNKCFTENTIIKPEIFTRSPFLPPTHVGKTLIIMPFLMSLCIIKTNPILFSGYSSPDILASMVGPVLCGRTETRQVGQGRVGEAGEREEREGERDESKERAQQKNESTNQGGL